MKKANSLSVITCFLLAGFIAFNIITYVPIPPSREHLSVSRTANDALKPLCDFPIEEKEAEGRLGQKNSNSQFLICLLQELPFTNCDKVKSYSVCHIPDFLQHAQETPLYLHYRSLLI
jgi:hypothetical protein